MERRKVSSCVNLICKMRCSICGKLVPNGTLCEDCYREAMEDKSASNRVSRDNNKTASNRASSDNNKTTSNRVGNNKVLIKLNRKFLPKYSILKHFDILLFCLFLYIYFLFIKEFSFFIFALILFICLFGTYLFISKRIAIGTKCLFYEDKMVYKFDFLFIHKQKTYKYSEISDIIYNQTFLQKGFDLGDIKIIPKDDGFFFDGVVILDVYDVKEVFKKLTDTIGSKIF